MKKILALTMAACCCIGITVAQKKSGIPTATVTVKQLAEKADTIGYVDTATNQVVDVLADKKGQFTMHIPTAVPTSVMLWAQPPVLWRTELYLEAGDAVNIATDYKNNTSFSGKGSIKQKLIYEDKKRYADLYDHIDWDKVSPDEVLEEYLKAGQQSIASLKANRLQVSQAFYDEQMVTFKYENLDYCTNVPIYMRWYSKAKRSNVIPAKYWDLEKEVELNDKLLSNTAYKKYMFVAYVDYMRRKSFMERGMRDTIYKGELGIEKAYASIASTYRGKVRSAAIRERFSMSFASVKDVSVLKPLIDDYVKNYAVPEDVQPTLAKYNEYTRTNVGQIPPYFVLKGLDGKEVALKDFAGKVVYMDFWASWCGPCRSQMKEGSPVLHEKFKDNSDVVFLYVSIDEKADAWKAAIAQDKIEGVHVLSPRGSENEVGKAFNIRGIPHYILIGRDGKIFDNNAPRPTEQKAAEKINEALGQDREISLTGGSVK